LITKYFFKSSNAQDHATMCRDIPNLVNMHLLCKLDETILGHPDFLHKIDFIKLLATTNLTQQMQHTARTHIFFCQNIKQKDAKGELISHNFDANNSSQQLV